MYLGFQKSKKRLMCEYVDGKPYNMTWQHIIHVYNICTANGLGMNYVDKLTIKHIELTSYSKMKVNLATQVLSESVAQAVEEFGEPEAVRTANFLRKMNTFFDIFNIRSAKEAKYTRKDVGPIRSPNDLRLIWLKDVFLKWLEKWESGIHAAQESVPKNHRLNKSEQNKMFISAQTFEGLKVSIYSLVDLTKYLFSQGADKLYTINLNQDPLESYFGFVRTSQVRYGNVTMDEFGYADNTIRNLRVLKPSSYGNTLPSYLVDSPLIAPPKKKKKADLPTPSLALTSTIESLRRQTNVVG